MKKEVHHKLTLPAGKNLYLKIKFGIINSRLAGTVSHNDLKSPSTHFNQHVQRLYQYIFSKLAISAK